jgi:DNA repair exonuclease SbcCD ATPase subunit
MFPLPGLSTKLMGIGLLIVVIAAGAYIGIQKVHIASLEKRITRLTEESNALKVDNAILKENNETLKDGLKKLASANLTNYNTAKQLLDERGKALDAITNLAKVNKLNNEKLDRLAKRVEEMLKDPKNDGPVAPVLREVIREIQKERAR